MPEPQLTACFHRNSLMFCRKPSFKLPVPELHTMSHLVTLRTSYSKSRFYTPIMHTEFIHTIGIISVLNVVETFHLEGIFASLPSNTGFMSLIDHLWNEDS